MFISYYWSLAQITNSSLREIVQQLAQGKECTKSNLTAIIDSNDVAAICIIFDQVYYWNSQARHGASNPFIKHANQILAAARKVLASPQIPSFSSDNGEVDAANWISASNALAILGTTEDVWRLVELMNSSKLPNLRLECLNAIRFIVHRNAIIPPILIDLLRTEVEASAPDKRILEVAVSILSLDQSNSDLLYQIARKVRPLVSGRICKILHDWGSDYASMIIDIANQWPADLATYEEDARFIRERYLPPFTSQ